MDYEWGLEQLKQLVSNTPWEQDFLIYEQRLRENLHDQRLYGSDERSRVDHAKIINGLNRLATHFGTSYNDLCLRSNIPNQAPPKPNNPTNQNAQTQPSKTAPTSQRTIAYISFHPRDKAYLDRLHTHLGLFVHKGMINYWDRTKILPGADQQKEITSALKSTRVAIALVSPEYLAAEPPDPIASYELPTLVPAAHKKEITILSVIVRPCDFALSDLEPFHPINSPDQPLSRLNPNEREKIWLQVAKQVRDILNKP